MTAYQVQVARQQRVDRLAGYLFACRNTSAQLDQLMKIAPSEEHRAAIRQVRNIQRQDRQLAAMEVAH